jgi:16S rRNA (guanine527-N7)-methyltransferase
MNEKEFINQLDQLNIKINDMQLNQLEKYFDMLIEYNSMVNITSIVEKENVYLKHFYDSITLIKAIDLVKNMTVCDIGTGAGFPGLVLKILFPNLIVTLVDSTNKKTIFLEQVIKELKLTNVSVINERAEDFSNNNREKYDLVTCRAVSRLNIISELCIPLVKVNGFFIPMKSDITEELTNTDYLRKLDSKIEKIYEFNLPIEGSKRTLIKIKKIKKTNNKFPRKFKLIKEKPL